MLVIPYICTSHMSTPHRYFVINKPYDMVSQFVSPDDVGLLGDLGYDFPEGIHAIGRLDNLSEGLLILTTNKKVTRLLFQGEVPHRRTYLVNVGRIVSPESLQRLQTGVTITITGGEAYTTPPCEVAIVERPADFFQKETDAAIYGPSTWLLITLYEGKFRQVRKMVKAVGHSCWRLIRVSIEDLQLGDLPPGGLREIEEREFFRQLKIDNWQG